MIKLNCIKRLYGLRYLHFALGKNYEIISDSDYFIELLDTRKMKVNFSKNKENNIIYYYIGDYFDSNPANKRFVIIEKTSERFNFKIIND